MEEVSKKKQEVEAERIQREEAERFEAKILGGNEKRKRRNRRRTSGDVTENTSFLAKHKLAYLTTALLTAVLAISIYFYV
ncbi:MAG: hypothetical protein ABGX43_03140 [Nitrospinaceae bacterium]